MNIKLRFITENDTDLIIKWRNSKAIVSNFIDRKPLTKDLHLSWINNRIKKGEVVQFICEDIDKKTDFASTYLKDINTMHKKAEFGFFIGEDEYRGKGIGKEIAKMTIDYGFDNLKLNKIYARVLSYNKASYNTFIKLGFSEDALLRSDVIIDGIEYDVYILSMLKKDWI